MGLQAGRVDGPLAIGGDQAALGNSLEDDRRQAMENLPKKSTKSKEAPCKKAET
jgi:hypothetical protein